MGDYNPLPHSDGGGWGYKIVIWSEQNIYSCTWKHRTKTNTHKIVIAPFCCCLLSNSTISEHIGDKIQHSTSLKISIQI